MLRAGQRVLTSADQVKSQQKPRLVAPAPRDCEKKKSPQS